MGKWVKYTLQPPDHPETEPPVSAREIALLPHLEPGTAERDRLLCHLDGCADCYEVLNETAAQGGHKGGERTVWGMTKGQLYALAASLILFLGIGGGVFHHFFSAEPAVVLATLKLDPELRDFLLTMEGTRSTGRPAARMAALLRERGVAVDALNRVEMASPYMPSKSLFGPEELVKVRIEGDTAYLEVVEAESKK